MNIRVRYLKIFLPLLISHHPNCIKFSNHVFNVGTKKLCLSCMTIYPTIVSSFIIFSLALTQTIFWILLTIGVIMMFPKIYTSIVDIPRREIKIITNIFFGLGISLFVLGIFESPFGLILNMVFFVLFLIVISQLSYQRLKKIIKTCDSCDYHRNWSKCPGFSEIYSKIENNRNFNRFK